MRQTAKKTTIGIDLVRRLAEEGYRIFATKHARQLAPEVGLKNTYLWEALHHLSQNGWIIPLKRGVYAISTLVPGISSVHEFEIAMALAAPSAISHWSALHHHGLTDQIPRKIFILVPSNVSFPRIRSKKRQKSKRGYLVGKTEYQFIQVQPKRYFGFEKVWVNEVQITITDPERTLLDGLAAPKYFGDFAEVLHAFEIRGVKLNLEVIIKYALKLDVSIMKRLGWVLEYLGINHPSLEKLRSLPINGYRLLDPTGPHKGPYNKSWSLQENLPGKV